VHKPLMKMNVQKGRTNASWFASAKAFTCMLLAWCLHDKSNRVMHTAVKQGAKFNQSHAFKWRASA
jgi:hypothetical protein